MYVFVNVYKNSDQVACFITVYVIYLSARYYHLKLKTGIKLFIYANDA